MSKMREMLREKLDCLTEGIAKENKVELEKLVFDLYHQVKESRRQYEDGMRKNVVDATNIADLAAKLDVAEDEIKRLRQIVKNREFNNSELEKRNVDLEDDIDKFRKPSFRLDAIKLDLIHHIVSIGDGVSEVVVSMNEDIRRNLINLARAKGDKESEEIIKNLDQDQLMMLAHMGFSELAFFKTLTGDMAKIKIEMIP